MKIGQTVLVKSICLFLCFFKGDLGFLRLETLPFLFLSPCLLDLPDFVILDLVLFFFLVEGIKESCNFSILVLEKKCSIMSDQESKLLVKLTKKNLPGMMSS